jgi:carbamoylphosphate synthase large subunit
MTRVWFNKTFSSIHIALRLIREMDKYGRYEVICSSTNCHAISRLSADQFFVEPSSLSPDEYREWCLSFAKDKNIQIFIPGKEAALLIGDKERFAQIGTRILGAASPAALDILHDKARFYAEMASSIAPPAKWRQIDTPVDFDDAYTELSGSETGLCIKPAVSVYGIGFRRISTIKTAFQIMMEGGDHHIPYDDLRLMLSKADRFPKMLLMEYLDGHEYSVDCLCDYGRLVCAVSRKKPLRAGEGQLITLRDEVVLACREISAQFCLNGFINIQFREGRSGLCVLEVNPRMSGGIGMACLAGVNLPYFGVAGFDHGYDQILIPPVLDGLRVGEMNYPVVLP